MMYARRRRREWPIADYAGSTPHCKCDSREHRLAAGKASAFTGRFPAWGYRDGVCHGWFSRRPACRPREQRPASVTSETVAVLLASKRVVSFNWEVFGLPHNLHRVDGGRADTSIFRLARDHRGEAPNRRNAHNNGACGYDSCSHVGAPFKTNMPASVRF